MERLSYRCLNCAKDSSVEFAASGEWQWNVRSSPRVRCPHCGCACYPLPWFDAALRQEALDARIVPTGLAHEMWSGCPNSARCIECGQYSGDCEEDLPARPKCLVHLHAEIRSVSDRLAALEKRSPGRRGGNAKE